MEKFKNVENLGVRVVHLITYPFPNVWHTADDNRAALDSNTIHNLATILRIFAAQYLRLDIPDDNDNGSFFRG